MSRMFQKEGKRVRTWNPLAGECGFHCGYCWARRLIQQKKMTKYEGNPVLHEKAFDVKFKRGEWVFVQSMSDLFHNSVSYIIIEEIRDFTNNFPDTNFLFLTKNAARYNQFIFYRNNYLGVTLETNREDNRFDAPERYKRFQEMVRLNYSRKFISIEPIMDFDFVIFLDWIHQIRPEFVYIGYDNYSCNLDEPLYGEFLELINEMREFTEVHIKTTREGLKSEISHKGFLNRKLDHFFSKKEGDYGR